MVLRYNDRWKRSSGKQHFRVTRDIQALADDAANKIGRRRLRFFDAVKQADRSHVL
jgi:hypothetical protein